jgi:hypothetical protein
VPFNRHGNARGIESNERHRVQAGASDRDRATVRRRSQRVGKHSIGQVLRRAQIQGTRSYARARVVRLETIVARRGDEHHAILRHEGQRRWLKTRIEREDSHGFGSKGLARDVGGRGFDRSA